MSHYLEMTIGEIVADNFSYAEVFSQFNIDFCCRGNRLLKSVIETENIEKSRLLAALQEKATHQDHHINFKAWPLELLVDYVTKYHHAKIREKGPELLQLCQKVAKVHGESHPELITVAELFESSLEDLLSHLYKEDHILFPVIYHLAGIPPKLSEEACFPSIEMPISVMMQEHDQEGERFRQIAQLTHQYHVPADACQSYRLMMTLLKKFEQELHEHIHVENNIIFPEAIHREAALRA